MILRKTLIQTRELPKDISRRSSQHAGMRELATFIGMGRPFLGARNRLSRNFAIDLISDADWDYEVFRVNLFRIAVFSFCYYSYPVCPDFVASVNTFFALKNLARAALTPSILTYLAALDGRSRSGSSLARSWSHCYHPTDVGADKFLGVRRIFARISPNLPEKFLCAFYLQIFSHKDHDGLFWVRPPKKVFMCFSANVVRHFLKSNNIRRHCCPDFQGFCQHFQRFCPDFQQIKTFGDALASILL